MNCAELLGCSKSHHPPISSLNLYTVSMHDGIKTLSISFLLSPRLFPWNETLVEMARQCNWGHIQKHSSPSSQFSNCSSNNMVLSARKKKSECVGLVPSPSLLSPPWLWAKAIFFFPLSFKRWNRQCWMMDRCAGIVLFCSALKEIIDLHYSPTHKTPTPHLAPHTHAPPSASSCSTLMIAPPPTWPPTPRLLIKEWMFILLPVFYRGGVLSQAHGTTSPELTWEGKLSCLGAGFTSAIGWCRNHMRPCGEYTSGYIKQGILLDT